MNLAYHLRAFLAINKLLFNLQKRCYNIAIKQFILTEVFTIEKRLKLAYIEYYGIDTRFCNAAEFLNSAEFRAVLDANPHLQLLETEYSDIWGEDAMDLEITLPVRENYPSNLFIRDTLNNNTMNVIYDDLTVVEDPSPEFIEVLELMNVFSVKTFNKRIFEAPINFKTDAPEILSAEFDFQKGSYKTG